jgi:hypothetical protein
VVDRHSVPFPDAGQGFMRYVDYFCLGIFRSVERDSRNSRGLFVKCVGMNLELDVGEQEGFIAFGFNVNAGDLNASDMILVLKVC